MKEQKNNERKKSNSSFKGLRRCYTVRMQLVSQICYETSL